MFKSRPPRSFSLQLGAVALALAASSAATAASHALILHNTYEGSPVPEPITTEVGRYCPVGASMCFDRLIFARQDAQVAVKLAKAMGVPKDNIAELSNAALDHAGMRRSIGELTRRVQPGDSVFIYYSGHGGRQSLEGSVGTCQESITTFDGRGYTDQEFLEDVNRLVGKAGRLVVINDSCFSGGVLGAVQSKSARGSSSSSEMPIAKSGPISSKRSSEGSLPCDQAVNDTAFAKGMRGAAKANAARVVYVAAASHDEVSFGTASGSYATLSMLDCISPANADTNRSGTVDAKEFQVCTQRVMNERFLKGKLRQTITLHGDESMPLFFSAVESPSAPPVDAQGLVQDILQGAQKDKGLRLADEAGRSSYRIVSPAEQRKSENQMRFVVATPVEGYLYLFQVKARKADGSQSIIQLFPNALDKDNQVRSATVSIPAESKRSIWAIAADGPAGESQLLALVSERPLDANRLLPGVDGPFRSGETGGASRLSGKAAAISLLDRYWVSNVLKLQELR